MLRACRHLLRPGGRLAFFTIFVTPGLPPDAHRRAVAAGPPEPSSPELPALLRRAGFAAVEEHDVTGAYLRTTRAWLRARTRLREQAGPGYPAVLGERIEAGRAAVAAIEDGLLRRSLLVAERP